MNNYRPFLLAVLLAAVSCTSSVSAGDPWAEADRILSEMTQVHFPDRSVSITDFGAVEGDPDRLATEAINNAASSSTR